MNDEIKVKLQESIGSFGVDIFLYKEIYNKRFILNVDESGNLIESEIDIGSADLKPTIKGFPTFALDVLFDALQERGCKPKDLGKIEGLLEGKDAHLQDMRKLLKLK